MSGVATAIAGGAVLGAIVTSNASSNATRAQSDAARDANSTQLSMYNQTREDQQPWRQAGQGALTRLTDNNIFGEKGFEADPGYQFRMSEGMKAINSNAAARGAYNSGATLKALARYGQNFATNEYNNVYNRQYNRLSSLAGFGQTANNQVGNAGANYANQMGSIYGAQGNAAAANSIAQGNAINSGIQGAGNAFNQYQTMRGLSGGGASGGSNMVSNDMGFSGYRSGSLGQGGI